MKEISEKSLIERAKVKFAKSIFKQYIEITRLFISSNLSRKEQKFIEKVNRVVEKLHPYPRDFIKGHKLNGVNFTSTRFSRSSYYRAEKEACLAFADGYLEDSEKL